MLRYDDQPLFIFEMANNHMGDVSHGLRLIDALHEARASFPFRFGLKFQYRDLDTFIHSSFQGRMDIKYVKRFSETRLSDADFEKLRERVWGHGMLAICTPFDEVSVERVQRDGYDILKIASCSLTDWPLLERIVATDLPLIASTAGETLDDIDRVALFLEHRGKEFALMHCVGEYPTSPEHLELNQIDLLRDRYPEAAVGYSTHESPDDMEAVRLAVAKGACIFEKHVALETGKYSANAYSATPQQIRGWLLAAEAAYKMCGVRGRRRDLPAKELDDLRGLKRGVFARRDLPAGARVESGDLLLAIPCEPGQILANDLSKYAELTTTTPVTAGAALTPGNVARVDQRERILDIISKASVLLRGSGIALPDRLDFEVSHHYGIERFEEYGACIVNIVNREYCKKLIILIPGQKHPCHAHRVKEETFHVLYGDMTLILGGEERSYRAGDFAVVERSVPHEFSTVAGVIIEEISTTHHKDDSFYDDESIAANVHRKTEMTFWADWLIAPPK
jgi:sialic acid synthase SpsE/mannose-6-phosphate isomerase-like protein (cupin superfamily)